MLAYAWLVNTTGTTEATNGIALQIKLQTNSISWHCHTSCTTEIIAVRKREGVRGHGGSTTAMLPRGPIIVVEVCVAATCNILGEVRIGHWCRVYGYTVPTP